MTDPAPPARTTLTPECVYPHGMLDFMDTRCPSALAHGNAEGTWKVDCAPCFAEFSRAARAEGRLAGLEEAAQVAENPYGDLVEAYGRDEPKAVGTKIAGAIRRLAEDGPKAPQDPEDPEKSTPRVPR